MNTIEDIIEWIKDYDNSDDNIEKFTAELIQMITDMYSTVSTQAITTARQRSSSRAVHS